MCDVRLQAEVHVEDECTRGSSTWKINLAGSSDFGGQLVPFLLFCDRIKSEPLDICVEMQGDDIDFTSHNLRIVGQFVPQMATWKARKGEKY